MITRDAAWIKDGISVKMLKGVLVEHDKRKEELDKLRDYYDGKHDILKRIKDERNSNNKLVINHAKYITDLASAYLIGNPVSYADDTQQNALDSVMESYDHGNIESVDAELAKHASIYGRAVELLFITLSAAPSSAVIDPRDAFVVYDDTVAHNPLFGVHRTLRTNEEGIDDGCLIIVYDLSSKFQFEMKKGSKDPTFVKKTEDHHFGGVPIIEYWNDEDERGDFQQVMTLIDAYNLLMCDRVNDKEQLVNAILVITGASLGDDDAEFEKSVKRISVHRVLELDDDKAKAGYITKQLTESEVQVLADALSRDIHKISMVPAMTDENFAGQASGVSMRFKLLGLEQRTKTKERWFREGLRSRLRLFSNLLAVDGSPKLDAEMVQMTFSRGLPSNDLEQAEMVQKLQGIVPDEILIGQLSFVSDIQKALDMLENQRVDEQKRQEALFPSTPYPNANKQPDSEVQDQDKGA